MTPSATLGLYAGALVLVFGAALGVGGAVGPVGTAAEQPAHSGAGGTAHAVDAVPAAADPADLLPSGLAVTQDGYALELASAVHPPGRPAELQFEITGPDGRPVTDYLLEQDQELHLIVVRRDLTGYQHLHPERDAAGRWSIALTLAEPGPYKVLADFVPAERDEGLVLAADLTAPGPYTPAAPAPPAPTSTVDGYQVTLDGDLTAGTSSPLTLSVARDGRPVTDLQPYLGAYGHLVVLRAGDLAYLHVHPDGAVDDPGTEPGPDISFSVDVPDAATYRLFLDFQHAGEVRTASFAASAERSAGSAPEPGPPGSGAHDDDH